MESTKLKQLLRLLGEINSRPIPSNAKEHCRGLFIFEYSGRLRHNGPRYYLGDVIAATPQEALATIRSYSKAFDIELGRVTPCAIDEEEPLDLELELFEREPNYEL